MVFDCHPRRDPGARREQPLVRLRNSGQLGSLRKRHADDLPFAILPSQHGKHRKPNFLFRDPLLNSCSLNCRICGIYSASVSVLGSIAFLNPSSSFCVSGRDTTNDAIATVGFESENSAFNADTRRLAISVFPSGGSSFWLLAVSKELYSGVLLSGLSHRVHRYESLSQHIRTAKASRAVIALKKSRSLF